jgi:hypothetical protein
MNLCDRITTETLFALGLTVLAWLTSRSAYDPIVVLFILDFEINTNLSFHELR